MPTELMQVIEVGGKRRWEREDQKTQIRDVSRLLNKRD
jgi:hypothetical protein